MNDAVERELILGGQKSGKSRLAEMRAVRWLARPGTNARLLATALAGDPDMAERIARHQRDRRLRAPALQLVECANDLPARITALSEPGTLLIIDCITLWLTQRMMPMAGTAAGDVDAETDALLAAIEASRGPVITISNEISLGIIPLDRDCRQFVDTLGMLHQRLGQACSHVTLMVAGCELPIKRPAR